MRKRKEDGQAMVEFALVLPVIILLICGIIDFGWIFGNQILANNAAREAARYTAIHYNDSIIDDDEAIARAKVTSKAPTLSGANVSLSVTGGEVTVSVDSDIGAITSIFPISYKVKANSVMRLE